MADSLWHRGPDGGGIIGRWCCRHRFRPSAACNYEAVLRYFGKGKIRSAYIPEAFVKMHVGGEINKSLSKIIGKSREDYRALRTNGIGSIGALARKNLSKVRHFISN